MTAQELKTYIDRVLGSSIRCLLPSYWWKRLLSQIVEYVNGIEEKADKKINDLKKTVDNLDVDIDLSNYATKDEISGYATKGEVESIAGELVNVGNGVSSVEQRLSNLYGFVITTGDKFSASSSAWVDGDVIFIAPKTSQKVRFSNSFTLHGGYNIISIDTSLANTSQMTTMSEMFKGAEDLTSVDISTFDTSNVTDMSSMFSGCKSLTALPIEYFDMSNVINASNMFYNCSGIVMDDIRFLNATKITDVSNMFNGCANLGGTINRLYLYDLDTSHVTNMSGMFANCANLNSLHLDSKFDTSSVENMDSMFDGCDNLEWLYLDSNFFKMPLISVDLSVVSQWTEHSLIYSLVDYSYDRATNGLPTLEIKLHSNVYAYLTDEHKATLTAKGYNVVTK